MTSPKGNVRLKSARIAAGYPTQQALCDAIAEMAADMGLRGVAVTVRTVRRWESDNPPWPKGDVGAVLERLFGQSLEDLGFTPSWTGGQHAGNVRAPAGDGTATRGLPAVPHQKVVVRQPDTVAEDFMAVTRAHRRLYWTVAPATLSTPVSEHARLGCTLLGETAGSSRRLIASALAESFLLAGRLEFFDLQQPDRAGETLIRALQAAGEADDHLMGCAILAHRAFIPAWEQRREEAAEQLTAARVYARRGPASADLLAWLDAVEAECETRCGNLRTALHLIGHAEDVVAAGAEHSSPEWLDWFSETRLAAFRGHTQLKVGHLPQARETLKTVLDELPPEADKQRSVILGDLAAVEAAASAPEEACRYATLALDQLNTTWYATGMARVRSARRALAPWQHKRCVRDLDDRLYAWNTTVSALPR
ncbi:transcriptional regulator [Streptomyces griseocarneus]|nr:transcriptional regulator [Streptomyces griseocarneus]